MTNLDSGASVTSQKLARAAAAVFGGVSLFIGTVGFVIPFVPTTIFIVLAGFCFRHGNKRIHCWMGNNRVLGKVLRYYDEKGVPFHIKIPWVCGSTLYSGVVAYLTLTATYEFLLAGASLCVTVIFIALLPDRTKKPRT